MSLNEALASAQAIRDAYASLQKQSRVMIPDPGKSWDLFKAVAFITACAAKEPRVLDMGTQGCRLLEILASHGFRHLYGCDIAPVEWRRRINQHKLSGKIQDLFAGIAGYGPIKLSRQNLEKTKFSDAFFDFVTSLSVIEHGVDTRAYFRESARLLVSGGYLITSLDFWPQKIATDGISLFNEPWVIFSEDEVEDLIKVAAEYGLHVVEPIDYTCVTPAVHSSGKEYTFLFFVMQKK